MTAFRHASGAAFEIGSEQPDGSYDIRLSNDRVLHVRANQQTTLVCAGRVVERRAFVTDQGFFDYMKSLVFPQ